MVVHQRYSYENKLVRPIHGARQSYDTSEKATMKKLFASLFRSVLGIALGIVALLIIGLIVAGVLDQIWVHNLEGKSIVTQGKAEVTSLPDSSTSAP